MGISVVTNFTSLVTQNTVNQIDSSLQTSTQRLSTGKRVNSPTDDAASYAISARQSSDILSFAQALRNVNDGVSVIQTVSSALGSKIQSLQRMRTLALQALNDTNSSSDRNNLNLEFKALAASITELANKTKFNGQNLLDGSFSAKTFQVGLNTSETIAMSFNDVRASAIGNFSITAVNAGDKDYPPKEMPALDLGEILNPRTGNANAVFNNIGTGETLTIVGHLGTAVLDSEFEQASLALGSATATTRGMSAEAIVKAVKATKAQHGVDATAITEMTLQNLSTAGLISFKLASGTGGTVADYAQKSASITANITDTSDLTAIVQAVNDQSKITEITARLAENDRSKIILTSKKGANIQFADMTLGTATLDVVSQAQTPPLTLTSGGTDSILATGLVTYHSSQSFTLDSSSISTGSTLETSAGFSAVEDASIKDAAAAKSAIFAIDEALNRLTDMQAVHGSIENRLQVISENLESQSLNTENSRGRIEDTDFSFQAAQQSKLTIRSQVGTAMLAQANQVTSIALQLI